MRILIVLLLMPCLLWAIDKNNSNSLSPQTLQVECPPNITLTEGQKIDTSVTGFPKILSNDGGVVTISYIEIFNNGNCSNSSDVVTRIFTIRNAVGDIERCTQNIFLKHLTVSQVRIPTDTTIEYPINGALGQAILGHSLKLGSVELTFIDTKVSNACTIPVRVRREWSIRDKCNGNIVKKTTNITLISYQNSFEHNKTVITDLCGNEGLIVLTPKGEFGPYTYLWNTGDKTNSISNLIAGNYSAVITDKFKCTQLNSTTLTSMSETGDIGGRIVNEANYRVYPDSIYIDDVNNISKFCVSDNGGIQYAFKVKEKKLGLTSYRFVKHSQVLEGISTKDIIIIQRHILSKQKLSDTLKYFAADVNNNNTISTSDISDIRKLILGVIDEFPKVQPWYFFRPDWKTTISKFDAFGSIMFKGVNITSYPRLNADVLAVKMGDLDASFKDASNKLVTRSTKWNNEVFVRGIIRRNGDNYEIPIFLNNSGQHIEGFQFGLKFLNPNVKMNIVKGFLDDENYNIDDNVLKVSYSTGQIINFNNSIPLLTIKIPMEYNISDLELILDQSFDNEFYTEDLGENELNLKIVYDSKEPIIYVYPNPVQEEIMFTGENIEDCLLFISNLSGQLMYNSKIGFPNKVLTKDWPESIYYYQLIGSNKVISQGTFLKINN